MAITSTTGSATNSSSAVASLALPSFNLTAGQAVVVGVTLGSTSSSVSSITDTKGNTYTLAIAANGTGVRSELWYSLSVGVQTTNIITVHITGGNTSISAQAEEFAGVVAVGSTSSGSATSDKNVYLYVPMTYQAGVAIAEQGFACQSGDTLTVKLGTLLQSSVPAATAVGGGICQFGISSTTATGQYQPYSQINNSRNWVTVGLELRGSATAVTYKPTYPQNNAVPNPLIGRLPTGGTSAVSFS